MKKVLSLILICLCLVGCFSGCKQSNDLSPYLSETRDAIYLGSGKEFSLKATCGTRENPLVLDGKVGEVTPYTTFTFLTEIDYNISVGSAAKANKEDLGFKYTTITINSIASDVSSNQGYFVTCNKVLEFDYNENSEPLVFIDFDKNTDFNIRQTLSACAFYGILENIGDKWKLNIYSFVSTNEANGVELTISYCTNTIKAV